MLFVKLRLTLGGVFTRILAPLIGFLFDGVFPLNQCKGGVAHMGVYAFKKSGQSDDKLVNEFNKRVQKARTIPRVRSSRYHKKKLTRRQVRQGAVVREKYRAENARKKFYS